jgi:hypothetical protein
MDVTAFLLLVLRLGYDNLISPHLSVEANVDQDPRTWQFEPLNGEPLQGFPAIRQ